MDVIEIARTVLRRWYAMVPVLVLTALIAYLVASSAESQYETTGSFLLTDSSLVGADQPSAAEASANPSIIAEVVQGGQSQVRIREAGGTADYEVVTGAAEGLVRVTATGDTEEAAVITVQLVIDEVQRELAARQDEAGVPEQRMVAAEILSSPAMAQQEVTGRGSDEERIQYVATGSLQFIMPGDQSANPFTASFTGTIRILEEVMASPQARQELLATAGPGTYEVAMRPRDTAPIVNVTARATSPQGATDMYEAVVDSLRAELQQRQELAGVPPASMLTLQPLSVPLGVSLIGGELRRPLIVILGLGVVAAVSLAVLVEGLAARSRRYRGSRRQPGLPRVLVEPKEDAHDTPRSEFASPR